MTTRYGPHTEAWRQLERIAKTIERVSIASLYEMNLTRFERFSLDALGILFDFSRQHLDETGLKT